ncbi:MAG TPA: gluconeogenesis factor YvcK family protein [Patescibacteria group bacterium]|nr:gluconeogenesis factor YvcK family protein [Patescibacteria group bacterium]
MKKQPSIFEDLGASRLWLTLGIGIKRWLVILAFGALLAGTGIGSLLLILGQKELLPTNLFALLTLQFLPTGLRILVPFLLGGALIILAILRLGNNLVAPFKQPGVDVAHSLTSYNQRQRGPRIVAIGGGTGMPNLLRGLSRYTNNITAIVTVADDGGSSGRIRRELGLLPPGDFRNNIAALAQDEALMTQVLQYRFGRRLAGDNLEGESGELQGHSFGNLLLAALTGVTGSFDEALIAAGRVLAIRGQVLPSTLFPVTLTATIISGVDGTAMQVVGESAITEAEGQVEQVRLDPDLVPAYPPTVKAILQSDLVVIGPGSLYTSILPNLLVPDIARALIHTQAKRIYVCNLATQPGETDNYSVANHVAAIHRHVSHLDPDGQGCMDVILANNNLSVPPGTGGGDTVFVLPEPVDDIRYVTADLVDEERPWRHDSNKLAKTVMSFA